jgi:hypothetical protein
MGTAVNAAQAIKAYTISDRGTWLSFANKAISRAIESDPQLNRYDVLPRLCRVLSEPCSVFYWDRGFEAGLLQRRVHEPIGFCRRFHFALRRHDDHGHWRPDADPSCGRCSHERPDHGALRPDLPRRPGGRRGADGDPERIPWVAPSRWRSARSWRAASGWRRGPATSAWQPGWNARPSARPKAVHDGPLNINLCGLPKSPSRPLSTPSGIKVEIASSHDSLLEQAGFEPPVPLLGPEFPD